MILISRVTKNYSTSTEPYLAKHFYRPIHTSTTQGHLGFMQLGFQTTPKHNAQVLNTYLGVII